LNQPMQMIGHHNEGKALHIAALVQKTHALHNCTTGEKVSEQRLAPIGDRTDVIHATDFRIPPRPQRSAMRGLS
jgi:hypothetical protein